MPELPDVEVFRRYLDAHGLHRQIAAVDTHGGQDLLEEVSPQQLGKVLTGHSLTATRRHGKYLFAEIGGDGALVLHFGMTGLLEAYDQGEPPSHTRMRLDFADGGHLAFRNQRKLGLVTVTDSAEAFIADKQLGPDALEAVPDPAALKKALAGRRGGLKSTLMNQAVLAGIGNDYSDEVCFQARLDPRLKVDQLGDRALERLHEAIRRVLREAIDAEADPERMPQDFLLPRREAGAVCPRCGGRIAKLRISGRSGYWCPRCQGEAAS